jgi:Zn finger protein HypA/HybF involved in hydrogenase expression
VSQEITCPSCQHSFHVEDYEHGYCPNCEETSYYWDDDWNYALDEDNGSPGFTGILL